MSFFQAIQARKISFTIFQNKKNAFLAYKNNTFKKPKNWIFPKGLTHSFGQNMVFFSMSFFLGNIGQENVFYNLLERKNAFLAYKNNTFKKSKNWIFPKGLTHGFGQKMAIFPCLFFRQYRPGKCVLQSSRTKKRLSSL